MKSMRTVLSIVLALALVAPAMAQRERETVREDRRIERRGDSTGKKILKYGVPIAIGVGVQIWAGRKTEHTVKEAQEEARQEQEATMRLLDNAPCGPDFRLAGLDVEYRLDPRQSFSGRGRQQDQQGSDALSAAEDLFFRCGVNNRPDPELIQDLRESRGGQSTRMRGHGYGPELEMPKHVVYVGVSTDANDNLNSRTRAIVFDRNRFQETATLKVRFIILMREETGRVMDYVEIGSAVAEGRSTVNQGLSQRSGLYDASYNSHNAIYYAALKAAHAAMANIAWNPNYQVVQDRKAAPAAPAAYETPETNEPFVPVRRARM